MKTRNYARKKRQLKRLSTELRERIDLGLKDSVTSKLMGRVRRLFNELRDKVHGIELKKALGSLAVFFGLVSSPQLAAQSFDSVVQNPFNLQATSYLAAPALADMDGDGDLDMLVAEEYGFFKYFENTGTATSPTFAAPVSNPFGLTSTNYIYVFPALGDLDNDGDVDLMLGDYNGRLTYHENTGSSSAPAFAAGVSEPFGLDSTEYVSLPVFADLDNDGDLDLLVGEYYGMQYFENTGTASAPAFAAPVADPFNVATASLEYCVPAFADLDGDGDLDLMVGSYEELYYFQNTGTTSAPNFQTSAVMNPSNITSSYYVAFPAFADIDNDGDADLFVGEYYGNIQYYENTLVNIGLDELVNEDISVFPNPTRTRLNLETTIPHDGGSVINSMGQTLLEIPSGASSVDVSGLSAGSYILSISFESNPTSRITFQKL